MAEIELGNAQSLEAYRTELLNDFPQILEIAGQQGLADNIRHGQYEQFITWFKEDVAIANHGIAEGGFGLNREQSSKLNKFAIRHSLMAPTKLWTPNDELPQGALVGEIVDYSVLPDYNLLPIDVFAAEETLVQGATLSGMISRIDTGLGAVIRSDAVKLGESGKLTVFSGMRKTRADEGDNKLYREFLPEGTDPETPIEIAFPMEVDSAVAILRSRSSSFELVKETEDPEAGNKPVEKTHSVLGSRTWISRVYKAVLKDSGIPVEFNVINGEPITRENAMNRSTTEPAPSAPEIFKDWLRLPGNDKIRKINFAITFAHAARIGAELYYSGTEEVGYQQMAKATILGSMPQPGVFYKEAAGFHNGGTLTFKELYPVVKAVNLLLSRDPNDLSTDS